MLMFPHNYCLAIVRTRNTNYLSLQLVVLANLLALLNEYIQTVSLGLSLNLMLNRIISLLEDKSVTFNQMLTDGSVHWICFSNTGDEVVKINILESVHCWVG